VATFASAFTNSAAGKVSGHGGLIFNGGFTNQGQMQLSSGGTDIYGTVTNSGAGSITTASGSITTFYNDVTHSGSQIRTATGAFTVFFGNVHGAGSFTGPGTVDFEGIYTSGSAGANVSFSSDVTLGNTGAIVMNDGGTTEITGVPTFYSGSSIQVNNGELRFNVDSGAATIAAGVAATVNNGATLELAGSVSSLSSPSTGSGQAGGHRVNIVNNSTAAAGVLVSGTHQQVGNIDGSGITQVNAGSDLTANHIVQSALVIGGTAGSPALVTIDASDASGNPLDQPSGLALAGSLVPSGSFDDGVISSANSSSVTARDTDPMPLSAGNSVAIGDAPTVPEPSTLALALLAALGVVSTQFARHHFRCQTA
jgi:hypothetical protein